MGSYLLCRKLKKSFASLTCLTRIQNVEEASAFDVLRGGIYDCHDPINARIDFNRQNNLEHLSRRGNRKYHLVNRLITSSKTDAFSTFWILAKQVKDGKLFIESILKRLSAIIFLGNILMLLHIYQGVHEWIERFFP